MSKHITIQCNMQDERNSVSNFFGKKEYVITADSVPDYDDWGPDSYWGCSEWMQWHKENLKKYGKETADSKFTQAWSKHGMFSSPLDCRSFNTEFRNYMKTHGLLDAVYNNATIAKPLGTATDLVTDASNTVSDLSNKTKKAVSSAGDLVNTIIKWTPYIVGFIIIVIVYVVVSEKKTIIAKV